MKERGLVPEKVEEIQGVYYADRSTAMQTFEFLLGIQDKIPRGENESISIRMIKPSENESDEGEWEVRVEVIQRYPNID